MNIHDVSRRWQSRTARPVEVAEAVQQLTANQEEPMTTEEAPITSPPVKSGALPVSPVLPGVAAAAQRIPLKKKQRRSLEELQRVWQRLAVNILASNAERVPWTMGIASSIRGEGRTTSTLGIAYAIARETGEKVAIVELDLENPSIAEEVAPGSTPGLVEYLRGECEFEETFRSTVNDQIVVVPGSSGWKQSAISPTLDDIAVRLRHLLPEMVDSLKSQFNYTIVDLPPIFSNMQTERMAISLNGTIMIVRSGVTPMNLIEEAVDLMGEDNLLGAIQVGPPSPIPGWLSNLLAG